MWMKLELKPCWLDKEKGRNKKKEQERTIKNNKEERRRPMFENKASTLLGSDLQRGFFLFIQF
jgi:hypothetical protein